MNKHDPTIANLIQATHKYFPIGFSTLKENYPGYSILLNIIEAKINSLTEGKPPEIIKNLIIDIDKEIVTLGIEDMLHKQFPNYALSIVLYKNDSNEIHTTIRLNIRISLIANYFTLYFEEVSIHKNVSSLQHEFLPVRTHILSSSSALINNDQYIYNTVANLTKTYFPDFDLIKHYPLFTTEVRYGIPHGVLETFPPVIYPIYAFLFDNEYTYMSNIHVVV